MHNEYPGFLLERRLAAARYPARGDRPLVALPQALALFLGIVLAACGAVPPPERPPVLQVAAEKGLDPVEIQRIDRHLHTARQAYIALCLEYGEATRLRQVMQPGDDQAQACRRLGDKAYRESDLQWFSRSDPAFGIPRLLAICTRALGGIDHLPPGYCQSFASEQAEEAKLILTLGNYETGIVTFPLLTRITHLLLKKAGDTGEARGVLLEMDRRLLPPFAPNTDLQATIRQRFPPGMALPTILETLRDSGFSCSSPGSSGVCTRQFSTINLEGKHLTGVGRSDWSLRWHADRQNRLESLDIDIQNAGL